MSYQWKVGEPCIRIKGLGPHEIPDVPIGVTTFVTAIAPPDWTPWTRAFDGVGIRVYGATYPDTPVNQWYSDGDHFRPLHGTDIRKLEEKYPEYVIKTNEVRG